MVDVEGLDELWNIWLRLTKQQREFVLAVVQTDIATLADIKTWMISKSAEGVVNE